MRLEKWQTDLKMSGQTGGANTMAWGDLENFRRVPKQPVKDIEMVTMAPSLVTQRVHDQGEQRQETQTLHITVPATVENRNGQYMGNEEMENPLLG